MLHDLLPSMREFWLNGMTEWKMEWTSNAPISAMLSSLSRCPIFRQVAHCVGVIVRLVCNWVLVLVRMSHPSAAACQDVPSFVRWPIVCVCVCVCV